MAGPAEMEYRIATAGGPALNYGIPIESPIYQSAAVPIGIILRGISEKG
jgi:hypothetical protein